MEIIHRDGLARIGSTVENYECIGNQVNEIHIMVNYEGAPLVVLHYRAKEAVLETHRRMAELPPIDDTIMAMSRASPFRFLTA